ncbi:signal peptidase I [Microlunatus parietis]|uniref:Signal peptidase I n=1 Tax=Microlunatus parietis TaxID=682979 RepID=A0A7Y9IE73_9ACTN|nr:signal peptidase I [Microlunatus parietis]NYE75112.1 signal peptidase I [Microlunatus parietis]
MTGDEADEPRPRRALPPEDDDSDADTAEQPRVVPERRETAQDRPEPQHAAWPEDEPAEAAEPEPESAVDVRGGRDEDEDDEKQLTFGQHVLVFFKELAIVVVGAIVVAALLRAFVGQMFLIPSESMLNTLHVDDRVVAEKITGLTRGQVVVFADPGGWLSGPEAPERGPFGKALEFIGVLPESGTDHLIKRLIGLPGDRVRCCSADGRIEVNGKPLDETEYLYTDSSGRKADPSDINFDVVVPAGRIFVLGDNRANSRDSRCHLGDERAGMVKGENAFVSTDLVVGRGIAVVWPFGNLRALAIPSTFSDVPAGSPPPNKPTIDAGPDANC